MKLNVLILCKIKLLLLSVLTLGFSTLGLAANISSTSTGGAWHATSSWVGGVVPGPNDVVTIVNGATITVSSNTTATSITVNSEGTLTLAANVTTNITLNGGTLTKSATVSPSVIGNISVIGNNSSTITVAGSGSTLYVTGNIETNLTGTALMTINGPGLLNASDFTLEDGDDVVISTSGRMMVRNNLTLENHSTLTVNGVIVVKGTFETANNGNITTTGNGAFSAQGNVVRGNNTVTNSLSYCVAPDPCVFTLQNPTSECNRVCIALGGTPGNGGTTTLPVTLVNFSVTFEAVQSRVRLGWTTGSEINNDFFTIERSTDTRNFEEIETVKGAGNSRERLAYETYDENPLSGTSYYRLKQTDLNGQFTYHKLTAVENTNEAAFGFSLVPNPSNGQDLNLSFQGKTDGQLQVAIYGRMGQIIQESLESVTDGRRMTIQLNQGLQDGIYWVKVRKGNEVVTRKMMVANR